MAAAIFPVVDVSDWPVVFDEPRGVEVKAWLAQPTGTADPPRWLFKAVTKSTWGEQGEDWAEKITTEIAQLLGVPCADVELAQRGIDRGTISRNLAPPTQYQLFMGAVLLSGLVPGYRPGASNVPGRPGHNLSNIQSALSSCGPPPGSQLPTNFNAFDVFAGYLLLDALVANRDRHDENWAVLRPLRADTNDLLCDSYDHGSALGFGLTDQRRELFIREGRVGQWAAKGTAYRFEYIDRPPGLVSHARDGLLMAGDATRRYWLARLDAVSSDDMATIVDRVPLLSDPTRTFIVDLLRVNRGRLLDEC